MSQKALLQNELHRYGKLG